MLIFHTAVLPLIWFAAGCCVSEQVVYVYSYDTCLNLFF